MARFRGFKKIGRFVRNSHRRGRRIIGKTAATAKTILGRVDKLTGGAGTQALQSHPYGQAGLLAMEMADQYANQ